jgi:hypothetical protein
MANYKNMEDWKEESIEIGQNNTPSSVSPETLFSPESVHTSPHVIQDTLPEASFISPRSNIMRVQQTSATATPISSSRKHVTTSMSYLFEQWKHHARYTCTRIFGVRVHFLAKYLLQF